MKSGSGRRFEFSLINIVFCIFFIAMIGYLVYFIVVRSDTVISNSHNSRMNLYAEHVIRGDICSADGKTLATTKTNSNGKETRVYPYHKMYAHVVGYTNNGMYGLESKYNFQLLRSHSFFLEQALNDLQGKKSQGDTVVTTLNSKLQEAAYNSLGDRKGAVVVLNVKTGKVLAMVSKPDFDPNNLADQWDSIVNDNESSVLVNRVTNGLYPPGSTFKIVTSLEYMHEYPSKYQNFHYYCDGSITRGKTTIHCYDGEVHGNVDLTKAFSESCNTAFSKIGLSLNVNKFNRLADKLMFNKTLPTQLQSTSKSSFSLKSNDSDGRIMATSIGQGETLVTPLHMAMIAAAVDNKGVVMEPYLVKRIKNDSGVTVTQYHSKKYGSIMNTSDSKVLKRMMKQVVEEGTASQLGDDDYQAYGKTGSAEYNEQGDSHGWFVGFAHQKGKSDIAVAVIVEDGESGSRSAVPVAEDVFDAYYD